MARRARAKEQVALRDAAASGRSASRTTATAISPWPSAPSSVDALV